MEQDQNQSARVEGEGTPTGPLAPAQGYGFAPQAPPAQTGKVPPELRPTEGSQPVQPAPQMVARDHGPRRTPILGPLLLIGVGVIFLLQNLGVLDADVWGQLFQLWPLLLIAFGLDMLIGRRNPVLSLLLVLLVIAGGAALVYANGGWQTGRVASVTWDVDKGQAKSADVQISIGVTKLTLGSITGESNKLLMATLGYYENQPQPEHAATTEGDTTKVRISQGESHGPGWLFFGGKGANWDVHLNRQTPVKLTVNSGTGSTDLDLEQLKVADLALHAGTGSITVIFPSNAGATHAVINGGVGGLDLEIPQDVEAHIEVSTGIGGVDVDNRFAPTGDHIYESSGYSKEPVNKLDLEVHAGVGGIDISSK